MLVSQSFHTPSTGIIIFSSLCSGLVDLRKNTCRLSTPRYIFCIFEASHQNKRSEKKSLSIYPFSSFGRHKNEELRPAGTATSEGIGKFAPLLGAGATLLVARRRDISVIFEVQLL